MRKLNCLIIGPFLIMLPSFTQTGITDDKIHVIFKGDHADPSILKDGDDFYRTYSRDNMQPDVEIWH